MSDTVSDDRGLTMPPCGHVLQWSACARPSFQKRPRLSAYSGTSGVCLAAAPPPRVVMWQDAVPSVQIEIELELDLKLRIELELDLTRPDAAEADL